LRVGLPFFAIGPGLPFILAQKLRLRGPPSGCGAFKLDPVAALYLALPFAVRPPLADFSPRPRDKLGAFLLFLFCTALTRRGQACRNGLLLRVTFLHHLTDVRGYRFLGAIFFEGHDHSLFLLTFFGSFTHCTQFTQLLANAGFHAAIRFTTTDRTDTAGLCSGWFRSYRRFSFCCCFRF
jgi:hypothetical protein